MPERGRVRWHVEGPGRVCGSRRPAGETGDAGAAESAGPGAAGPSKSDSPGPISLFRVVPSLASPTAQMHRCSVWSEQQSCGDSEADTGSGNGAGAMLGAETLGLSHPSPSSSFPRELHLEQPGLQPGVRAWGGGGE